MPIQIILSDLHDQEPVESALIATAFNLLVKHPEKPLSVTQVIKAAGVSRASFYKYFSNKEDLFAAILLSEELAIHGLIKQMSHEHSAGELLKNYLNYCIQNIKKYKLLGQLETILQKNNETIERFTRWKLLRASHVDEFSAAIQSTLPAEHKLDEENIRFYYGLIWSIASGVSHLTDSDYFHELIADKRGFSKFLLESVYTIGEKT
ncbi:TetR/AcrR family transcriptional regulator [Reinekea marina]|uniref:TetR/AcrR family transcriptional regulator n=2 Tax=Reinekea marina TaxID=1310421 RepID=A0ABV7WNY7_9GAMM|nr:TetR/AcrR family transcriptional regulator [Reinekea forsetii]